MRSALVNGRILRGDRFVEGECVLLEGGRILDVVQAADARLEGASCHDLQGGLLLPGFIDAQVNGGGGVLFNDAPT
ncbi:MAG: N-acetylglucosamine-6-phosphate deacetylase, partial [Gammaproteobacteria bacterium]|nr:N-acetylglucosamine-6-phosphate deacetylase [Gammaproteobacteria bacterium]